MEPHAVPSDRKRAHLGLVVAAGIFRSADYSRTEYALEEAAMLVVLAEARFDASQMDKVRAVARPMIEASRAEPGCAGYDYALDMLEPALMRVRELWRDEQALKDHFATPHMAAFLKGLRELRPVSVTVKCYELGPERKIPNAA
jgi:quinol monooxygenase YgiN